jgi:hypothetical protein
MSFENIETKTPVIIPAFNEERSIGRLFGALMTLPEGAVDVVVASNGSTDDTVSIAEGFSKLNLRSKAPGLDIDVLDIPERGLVPATQRAVEHIGDRALNPFLWVYADSAPIRPKKWFDAMNRASEPDGKRSVVVSGPVLFMSNDKRPKESPVVPAMRTTYRAIDTSVSRILGARKTGENGGEYGPNMAFHLYDEAALERFLTCNSDPETGERRDFTSRGDVALTSAVVYGGNGVFKQIQRADALMLTPESVSYPAFNFPIKYALTHHLNLWEGLSEMTKLTEESYANRAATGAIDFVPRAKRLL